MKNISFNQYRAIDIGIMAVILFVFETLTIMAGKWFPMESYTLSPTTLILCIVMMRWDGFAAVHAVVGGFAFCLAAGAEPQQYLVYCIGNCFALLGLIVLKACGKEKVRTKVPFAIIYVVIVFIAIQTGRWVVSMIQGSPIDSIISFLMADSLSLLFAAVAVLISRKMDGLFEDQKQYLIRTEEERMRERNSID
ncbi:MAG: hypothetical protein ACI4WS_12555 [Oscillospiraceae bacterium]